MNTPYQSQHGQDAFLDARIFRGKRDGFFIDIGAHDGLTISNTYFFEKERGWRGLCVEPRQKAFDLLAARRSAVCEQVCIASERGVKRFLEVGGEREMLSGLYEDFTPEHLDRIGRTADQDGNRVVELPCVPLADLLEKHGILKCDFCSIDTEGSELEILRSIDFDKVRIAYFVIENYGKESLLRGAMAERGYVYLKRLRDDDIYVLGDELKKRPDLYLLALYANTLGRLVDYIARRRYILAVIARRARDLRRSLLDRHVHEPA